MPDIQEAYKINPTVFMDGYLKAKNYPNTATIANDNPFTIESDYVNWRIWNCGFENFTLSTLLEDMEKLSGVPIDHTYHIMVEEE